MAELTWYTPSIVPTEQNRENTKYGTLATADEVAEVEVSESGILFVLFHALWKESVAKAGRAAIFIGPSQLTLGSTTNPPYKEAATIWPAEVPGTWTQLTSAPQGLLSGMPGATGASSGEAGQVFGFVNIENQPSYAEIGGNIHQVALGGGESLYNFQGGICPIFIGSGSYNVSVKFLASSGKVTAKERRLYVWTLG